ncbi:glycosyl hydrolase family 3 N terminal domain-containing protein [Colletotrichum higginsianum IMI 349063]|uniref:xylan 1,4-beta-xylosidase n=2 Tax=Colletotrichum higginsianum TaxID=80884 RepID=A0A1B7Y4R8_COLHI|nr:glycosyl hydrolase family 3 N terminal domain-containing protein [Colletotrichum higginsianum IMI 349063]OBR06978.1 glycosyl hydrolase family 3 N terminal domain-containing protein [Colletotrichum higginsianum IMI 349063]TIC92444.1 putative exo-1,4-beta-xylosidase bxlB [Colletotrichum higginsianum]
MLRFVRNSALLLYASSSLTAEAGPDDLQKPLTPPRRTCLPARAAAVDRGTGAGGFPDCRRDPLCSNDVCDESLPPRERAAALVAALTVREKLDNLVNEAPGVPRLGVPPYEWWSEGLHGLASSPGTRFSGRRGGNFSHATSFPQPIVLGSAFDDALVRAVGHAVSTEARAFSNHGRSGLDLYSPNINAFKDPRWGRGQETPGEDPFHLQSYVAAMLTGLEGDSSTSSSSSSGTSGTSRKRLIATCKHYAANDFENYDGVDRAGFDANITTQDLSEYYLPPFKTCAVERGGVGSFMCSYNGVNGTPLCANQYLLRDVLRRHWGWDGAGQYVSTDCDCVALMVSHHRYAPDLAHAAAWAMKAGTDLECNAHPGSDALQMAWNRSLISEREVDGSLTRMYTALVSVGQFDSPREQPLRSLSWEDVDTEEARELAYRAAVEGAVLLKNDGTLPLSADARKYALVGPWANATTQMQGNYFGPAPYLISPYQAAKDLGLDVTYTPGCRTNDTDASFRRAVASARAADLVVFAGGVDNTLEAETLDRRTLAWPDAQIDLLRAVAALGKPVVVLQFGGGQVDDAELLANASINAVLWGGYPGQSGGRAIFDLLFGRAAPAGRLSVTQYPASYSKAVPATDMNLRPGPGNSGLGRTYMWFNGEAPVPYGSGLHYTTFDVKLEAVQGSVLTQTEEASPPLDDVDTSGVPAWQRALGKPALTVAVKVTNTGGVSSDYVALLFLRSNAGLAPRPRKTLAGYFRFRDIRPGERAEREIAVTVERLVRVDESGNRVLHPGSYEVFVDVDEKSTIAFEVGGPPVVVEEFPQPRDRN